MVAGGTPPLARAMAVSDGDARDLPIHIRGSHLALAPKVTPRGALSVTDPIVPALDIADTVLISDEDR